MAGLKYTNLLYLASELNTICQKRGIPFIYHILVRYGKLRSKDELPQAVTSLFTPRCVTRAPIFGTFFQRVFELRPIHCDDVNAIINAFPQKAQ